MSLLTLASAQHESAPPTNFASLGDARQTSIPSPPCTPRTDPWTSEPTLVCSHCARLVSARRIAHMDAFGLSALMQPATLARVAAGILGATAIGTGAFGSHALPKILAKKQDAGLLSPDQVVTNLATWKTATHYHLVHAVVLLVLSGMSHKLRYPLWSTAGIIFGTVVMCGAFYLKAAAIPGMENVGRWAPHGGWSLIASWLTFAL